jgi:hypothetical protein
MHVNGQLQATNRFNPEERDPGTHWIGGWIGPRTDIDAVAKSKISFHSVNRTPVDRPVALVNISTEFPRLSDKTSRVILVVISNPRC